MGGVQIAMLQSWTGKEGCCASKRPTCASFIGRPAAAYIKRYIVYINNLNERMSMMT